MEKVDDGIDTQVEIVASSIGRMTNFITKLSLQYSILLCRGIVTLHSMLPISAGPGNDSETQAQKWEKQKQ